VVARLAAVREPAGKEVSEGCVVLDELVTQAAIPGAAVGAEPRVDVRVCGALVAPLAALVGVVPGAALALSGPAPLPCAALAHRHHQPQRPGRPRRFPSSNAIPAGPSASSTS